MNDAALLEIKKMADEELNNAVAMAEYLFDSHYRSCPYCRNHRAQQLAPCTANQALSARLAALEAEQEDRSDTASIESERRAGA